MVFGFWSLVLMTLKLYSTLTRRKEVFKPIHDKKVGLYCCGPTVYWYAHLGNLRTFIFEDILRRTLEYNGYKVKHIMNYTDVGHLTSDNDSGEDKVEKGARREGKTAWEIADFYIKEFQKDAKALNILPPSRSPRATEHIKEQIDLIKILEKKDYAYKISDGVYFDTSKLPSYGQLSHSNIKGLEAGSRIEMVAGKKNPTDFALWKFSPPSSRRQMEWDSPWAPPGNRGKVKGFPGWHIECSAMTKKYLGEQFDIHCGGIDHIQVHHTNEIAQSQAAFGCVPAKFWLHGEFLLVDSGRMGKSEENFLTVKTLSERGFGPLTFRYLCLTTHYRSKLNFTWESLKAAQNALNNLYDFFASTSAKNGQVSLIYKNQFLKASNNDLDTPAALAALWKLIKDKNISGADKKRTLLDFDKILGLGLDKIKRVAVKIPREVKNLAKEREQARAKKDWQTSDKIRQKIQSLGYQIEDTKEGPKIKKI